MTPRILTTVAAALLATAAFAGSHSLGNETADMRAGVMKEMGKNLGILGSMAKGEAAYDAATATAAAEALLAAASVPPAELWVAGTGNPDVAMSRAKPAIFTDTMEVEVLHADLVSAATAMVAAAGTDLDSLRGAMGPIGASCGACHETYRLPKQ